MLAGGVKIRIVHHAKIKVGLKKMLEAPWLAPGADLLPWLLSFFDKDIPLHEITAYIQRLLNMEVVAPEINTKHLVLRFTAPVVEELAVGACVGNLGGISRLFSYGRRDFEESLYKKYGIDLIGRSKEYVNTDSLIRKFSDAMARRGDDALTRWRTLREQRKQNAIDNKNRYAAHPPHIGSSAQIGPKKHPSALPSVPLPSSATSSSSSVSVTTSSGLDAADAMGLLGQINAVVTNLPTRADLEGFRVQIREEYTSHVAQEVRESEGRIEARERDRDQRVQRQIDALSARIDANGGGNIESLDGL